MWNEVRPVPFLFRNHSPMNLRSFDVDYSRLESDLMHLKCHCQARALHRQWHSAWVQLIIFKSIQQDTECIFFFMFPSLLYYLQCDRISLYNEWKCLAWNVPPHFTTHFPTYQCTPMVWAVTWVMNSSNEMQGK